MEPRRSRTSLLSAGGHLNCQTSFDHHGLDKDACVAELLNGMKVRKYIGSGKPHFRFFSISEFDRTILVWTSDRKRPAESRIQLNHVWKIDQGQRTKRMIKHYDRSLDDRTASIYYKNSKSLDLLFDSRPQLETFLGAIQHLIEEFSESINNERLRKTRIVGAAWGAADVNRDNCLTYKEVKQLLKQQGWRMHKKELEHFIRDKWPKRKSRRRKRSNNFSNNF